MEAIRVEGLSKFFSYRQGISRDAAMGEGHWLIGLLIAARNPRRFVTALDGISLSVEEGSFVGLLGPNGAGKTTLLKCISACLSPDRGTISVYGIDPVKDPRSVRRMISLCRSDSWVGIEHGLSVLDNLLMHGVLYGLGLADARSRAHELIELLGISHRANALPGNLSSGERQKLSLARALMMESRILLMDEPTAYLDPNARFSVKTYLRERVRESGVTAVLTTHDLSEAEDLCERVLIMDHGRLIADLSPSELRLVSQSVKQVRLIGSFDETTTGNTVCEKVSSLISRIPGVLGFRMPSSINGDVEITVTDLTSAYTVLGTLTEYGFHLQALDDGSSDIEDAYLKVVSRNAVR